MEISPAGQNGDGLGLNQSGSNFLNQGNIYIWAKSIDNATQSSGCVVAVQFPNGGLVSDLPVFTSTTTINLQRSLSHPGVLSEASCPPGATCRVQIMGIVRVQSDASGLGASQYGTTGATRCRATPSNTFDAGTFVVKMQPGAVSANAFFWGSIMQ